MASERTGDATRSKPPEVKICGITRREDALRAERLGADLVGVVLTAGFGRSVSREDAVQLLEGIHARRVAVLVDEPAERAVDLARAIGASVVQLHGEESPETAREIGASGPWRVWKAVRARSAGDVARAARAYAGAVDGLLVEGSREGVVGGGGATLTLSAESVRDELPDAAVFVLAGGLTPGSVGEAVRRFAPDVVDVSSGVERERGRKDEDLVRRFIAAAKGGA